MANTDPTAIRAQPALTTSDGKVWLIVGGLFALISIGVLIPMTTLPPRPLALIAAIVVFALYAAMVAVRILVPQRRARLAALAVLMLTMAAVALVVVAVVTATTWNEAAT